MVPSRLRRNRRSARETDNGEEHPGALPAEQQKGGERHDADPGRQQGKKQAVVR
jgi:hypothetical protein